jgi:DNA modification methylase
MAENPEVLLGDCRAILPTLPAESVQCCVTSPPYWGLRDYGTAQWEGGDERCGHEKHSAESIARGNISSTLGPNRDGVSGMKTNGHAQEGYKSVCLKCGARRIDSQLGLEATPEDYIANMVVVFRAIWRVLHDDGTLWVNMGDSYAGAKVGNTNGIGESSGLKNDGRRESSRQHSLAIQRADMEAMSFRKPFPPGLKQKDLCMIPARLAMALQADGWYLRSEIVWHKPNPMPESVTDRPTKAHEMIYLLAKAERYFYDAEAIREPVDAKWEESHYRYYRGKGTAVARTNFDRLDLRAGERFADKGRFEPFRNKRSVWTIATQPYAEAHFATFPEEIPKLCILAGSKPGDTVLDPFAGSGTTGKVALELGRRALMIELNPDYIELARDRTFVTPGFF